MNHHSLPAAIVGLLCQKETNESESFCKRASPKHILKRHAWYFVTHAQVLLTDVLWYPLAPAVDATITRQVSVKIEYIHKFTVHNLPAIPSTFFNRTTKEQFKRFELCCIFPFGFLGAVWPVNLELTAANGQNDIVTYAAKYCETIRNFANIQITYDIVKYPPKTFINSKSALVPSRWTLKHIIVNISTICKPRACTIIRNHLHVFIRSQHPTVLYRVFWPSQIPLAAAAFHVPLPSVPLAAFSLGSRRNQSPLQSPQYVRWRSQCPPWQLRRFALFRWLFCCSYTK